MPFHTRRHHANADEFDLRGKAAIVTWEHEGLRNSRVSLPPLQVDRPGVVVYPLVSCFPAGATHARYTR